eukprot:GEMP01047911.1.p1 GENE.GEMP01047911.1~~GEMP01047911.1.p1  ORF type:complete len:301 (+),score=26.01 GEMP01047911.1:220-1122(+)
MGDDTAPRSFTGAGVAGAAASLISKTTFAPTDRIRIVLQNESLARHRASQLPYKGIFQTATRLHREQGLKSLWRGNGVNCARAVPTYFLRFYLFEFFKDRPLFNTDGLTRRICAGAISGTVVCCVTYPLEICRIRLAADVSATASNYGGAVDCLRSSYGTEGVRFIFKGLGVSIVEIAPFIGISFGLYDHITSTYGCSDIERKTFNKWEKLCIGTSSTIAALSVCYPLDTVRKQLMLDGSAGFHSRYQQSAMICAKQLYIDGGIPRLYKGFILVCCKAPALGLTLLLQDLFSKINPSQYS